MSRRCAIVLFPALLGLGACAETSTAPVAVATPGMASAELELQRSIDRVHDFLGSLNQRLETPSRQPLVLASTQGQPIQLAPAVPRASVAAVAASVAASGPREAEPLYGKHGVVWFPFSDGYTRVHCAPGSVCMLRLQAGETADAPTGTPAGWHADVVRGTRGIHAGWAVALSPSPDAAYGVLRLATSRRTYVLALDPTSPSMTSVAFTYADTDPASQAEPPAAGNGSTTAPTGGGAPDFAYQLVGPEAPWKPMRVYSDGTHTYIQFPPGGITTAPRLVIVAPHGNGTDSYRTVGDSYVIDGRVTDALLIGAGPGAPTIHITHGGRA